jgi:succinate-semialdehyde dehydrogenase / glutarate-semialdehyde dehydrogenase
MVLTSLNPATNEVVHIFQELSDQECSGIVDLAGDAFLQWRNTRFDLRSKLMLNAAKLLKDKAREYGELMALEMGKPIRQGIAESEKCAWVCEYYAGNAHRFLSPERVEIPGKKACVRFDPLGVILAVMPWNFPFWQVFRFAAPALMAGNAAILKHASNVPQCGLAIEAIFREAGFPDHLFRTVLIGSGRVNRLIEHDAIAAVTLTGSEFAGESVAAAAGKNLKKTVLELGGSDPFIVLRDADLEQAVEQAVISRMINTGQSCISAKRFLIEKPLYHKFEELFTLKMAGIITGNPRRMETDAGPMARQDLREELHRQVQASIDGGAKLLLGGKLPESSVGSYYEPTVLAGITPEMPVFREETFGPVAPLIEVENETEAIELANHSRFGLGASLWTRDHDRAEAIAAKLETGNVFVNTFVKSDPRLPFGGIKKSGYGRELSHFGIREFVNIKTVWID